ncbi:MAG: GxxExxY protein [bacterium]
MPITHAFKSKLISDDEFHAIDHQVMGLAFSIHNEMGRLWGETIYRNELAYRCQKAGFEKVVIEAPVQASYQDFTKFYYADLILDDAVIYEMKTVQTLIGEHHQQALNYLFLFGMQHGKLINMRPPRVESRFVSTRLTFEKRFEYAIEEQGWQELDTDSLWLKQTMTSLLKEWGAFLDIALFYDAIIHFRGGEENVVKKITVSDGTHESGEQKMHLLNPETAFKISALTKEEKHLEHHLRRFLHYTPLRAIQWINFNHDRIVFRTLSH